MTDAIFLRRKIEESGLKLVAIAEKLGITYMGLSKKLSNETEFKASEIRILAKLLNLTDEEMIEIFLPEK